MRKTDRLLLGTLCAFACLPALTHCQTLTGGSGSGPVAAKLPFNDFKEVGPAIFSQFRICAIVEIKEVPSLATRSRKTREGVTDYQVGRLMVQTMPPTVAANRDIPLYFALGRDEKEGLKPGRYLVIGWEANDKGTVQCELPDGHEILRGLPASQSLSGCEPKSYYAYGLIPTLDAKPGSGQDMSARILRSLLDCMKKPANDQALRIASNILSSVRASMLTPEEETIEGAEASPWSKANVVPDVSKLASASPVSELRTKGILAAWDVPGAKLDLLHRLPVLLPELRKADLTPDALQDDLSFLHLIHLLSGLDPNEAFDFCLKSGMWTMLLDPDLAAPSKDNQRKLLGRLFEARPGQRAFALNQLARWNGSLDKGTSARWSPESKAEIVLNEAALMGYWQEKIGTPIRP